MLDAEPGLQGRTRAMARRRALARPVACQCTLWRALGAVITSGQGVVVQGLDGNHVWQVQQGVVSLVDIAKGTRERERQRVA